MAPVLLVVGCINRYYSPGNCAEYPPPEEWEVLHLDASRRGIWDAARQRLVLPEIVADMREIPRADASVDRVQCWDALEHVNEADGYRVVAEFARVLRPGGILDLRVPNLGYLLDQGEIEPYLRLVYGDQVQMTDAELNVHRWGYTARTLADLLGAHGFAEEVVADHGVLYAVSALGESA